MGEPASEANLSGQMGGWVGSGYIKPEFISCTNEDTKQIVEQPSLEFIRKIWTENINLGTINREIYQKYEKEIKRRLLLGRKIMTNLDSIFKSRDILPTKVCLVKAMVFPVVMYECESWTVKKSEC